MTNKDVEEIKNYYFLGFDFRVGPEDRDAFRDELYVDVGNPGSEGVDTFSFMVCTPKGLEKHMKDQSEPYLFGRHHLIVPKYDIETIIRAVESVVNEIAEYGFDVT